MMTNEQVEALIEQFENKAKEYDARSEAGRNDDVERAAFYDGKANTYEFIAGVLRSYL